MKLRVCFSGDIQEWLNFRYGSLSWVNFLFVSFRPIVFVFAEKLADSAFFRAMFYLVLFARWNVITYNVYIGKVWMDLLLAGDKTNNYKGICWHLYFYNWNVSKLGEMQALPKIVCNFFLYIYFAHLLLLPHTNRIITIFLGI